MTVEKLIELLKAQDPDAQVWVQTSYNQLQVMRVDFKHGDVYLDVHGE